MVCQKSIDDRLQLDPKVLQLPGEHNSYMPPVLEDRYSAHSQQDRGSFLIRDYQLPGTMRASYMPHQMYGNMNLPVQDIPDAMAPSLRYDRAA